jgi:hypothetical protein
VEGRFYAHLRSVEGVQLQPSSVETVIAPDAHLEIEIEATFPDTFVTHSLTILADVTWNDRRLGEIAEAIAFW